ncbi:MAG: amidohydrolase, partial [Bacteroidetes bacterium]|nr:amidohydrolase [Bacteroidota bacterium]
LEWSIGEISRFLDRFPRAVVDMAERMMYLQYHSSRERQKVRNFIIKYQDRILYGTDLVQDTETDPDEFKKIVHNKWINDWKYLVTDEIMQTSEFDGNFKGLALPGEVVKKIYRYNALKMFPNAWNR